MLFVWSLRKTRSSSPERPCTKCGGGSFHAPHFMLNAGGDIRIPQTFPRGGPRALELRTTVDFRKREVLGALTGRVPGGP